MPRLRVLGAAAASLLVLVSHAAAGPTLSRVNGLVVMARGGVELGGAVGTFTVLVTPGTGRFDINAIQIDDTLKTGGASAYHYAQGAAASVGCATDFSKLDIHVEFDSKYTAKEGPSASAGMALAMLSALSGRPVRTDMAMTGDLTQLGEVRPVGGIGDKVTAAYRSGLHTVIIPAANAKDLPDLSEPTLMDFQVVTATHMTQVLFHGLGPNYPGPTYGQYAAARAKVLGQYRAGDWGDCEPALEGLLKSFPEDYSLQRLLVCGKARLLSDTQAVEQARTKVEALLSRAREAREAGKLATALSAIYEAHDECVLRRTAIERFVRMDEDTIAGVLKLRDECIPEARKKAISCMQNGDVQEACATWGMLHKLQPDNPDIDREAREAQAAALPALVRQVEAALAEGRADEGREILRQALVAAPGDAKLTQLREAFDMREQVAQWLAKADYGAMLNAAQDGKRGVAILAAVEGAELPPAGAFARFLIAESAAPERAAAVYDAFMHPKMHGSPDDVSAATGAARRQDWQRVSTELDQLEHWGAGAAWLKSLVCLQNVSAPTYKPQDLVPALHWALMATCAAPSSPELQAWTASLCAAAGLPDLAVKHLQAAKGTEGPNACALAGCAFVDGLCADAAQAQSSAQALCAPQVGAGDEWAYPHYLAACALRAARGDYKEVQMHLRLAATNNPVLSRYCAETPTVQGPLVHLLREYARALVSKSGQAIAAAPSGAVDNGDDGFESMLRCARERRAAPAK